MTPNIACDSKLAAATMTKPAAEKTHVNTMRKLTLVKERNEKNYCGNFDQIRIIFKWFELT